MTIFSITFIKNVIASVNEAKGYHYFDGEVYLYDYNDIHVFGLVKAESEQEAILKMQLYLVDKEIRKRETSAFVV
jgi:hypothetical protein